MSKESISKVYLIIEKIEYIEEIVKNANTLDDVNDEFNIHSLGDDEINDIVNKIKR